MAVSTVGQQQALLSRWCPKVCQSFRCTPKPTLTKNKLVVKKFLSPVCFKEGEEKAAKVEESKTVPQVAEEKGGYNFWSAGYFTFAVLQTAMGIALLAVPQVITEFLLKVTLLPPSVVFLRLAAATSFPMSAALFALQESCFQGGAEQNVIYRPTYRRLNLGIMMAASIMALGLQTLHWDINTYLNAGLSCGVGLCLCILCGTAWIRSVSKAGGGLGEAFVGWMSAVQNIFSSSNRKSVVYSIFTLMIAAMVVLQIVSGQMAKSTIFSDVPLSAINLYFKHVTAVGLFFAGVVTYTVNAACDVNMLHLPAIRKLNLGLSLMGATHFTVLLMALIVEIATPSPMLKWMLVAQGTFTAFTFVNAFAPKQQNA